MRRSTRRFGDRQAVLMSRRFNLQAPPGAGVAGAPSAIPRGDRHRILRILKTWCLKSAYDASGRTDCAQLSSRLTSKACALWSATPISLALSKSWRRCNGLRQSGRPTDHSDDGSFVARPQLPGAWGADIAGRGPTGVPMNLGGPAYGFLPVRKICPQHARSPARRYRRQRRQARLCLDPRDPRQHIRREKATSNIW